MQKKGEKKERKKKEKKDGKRLCARMHAVCLLAHRALLHTQAPSARRAPTFSTRERALSFCCADCVCAVLCRNENRDRIKKDNPGIGFGEITKKLAAEWKELSKSEKEPYEKMAKDDKKRSAALCLCSLLCSALCFLVLIVFLD